MYTLVLKEYREGKIGRLSLDHVAAVGSES